jgi:hypothetical protein
VLHAIGTAEHASGVRAFARNDRVSEALRRRAEAIAAEIESRR